jgi:Mor family transcriptional regulator
MASRSELKAAREKLIADFRAGIPEEQLPAEYGFTPGYVRAILRAAGHPKPRRRAPVPAKILKRNVKIVELADTLPLEEIAAKFNISAARVGQIVEHDSGVGRQRIKGERQQARNMELYVRHKLGEAIADLAGEFGVQEVWVRKVIKRVAAKLGETPRREDARIGPFESSPQIRKRNREIARRYRAGEAVRDLAVEFKLARVSIYKILEIWLHRR